MSNDYLELIEKVREIDPAAAEYIENEAPKLHSFRNEDYDKHEGLSSLFIFDETPQGIDYWWNICDQLQEY